MSQQPNSSLRVKRFWRYLGWILLCRALPLLVIVALLDFPTFDWLKYLTIFWIIAFIFFMHALGSIRLLPVNYRFRDGVLVTTRTSGGEDRYERWVLTWDNGLRVIHAQNSANTLCLLEMAYAHASREEKPSGGVLRHQ